MTTTQLYNDVAAMGFDRGFADDRVFYTAANRALDTLNARFPKEASVTVVHRPPKAVLALRQLVHKGGEELRIEAADVCAYSLLGACGARVEIYAQGRLVERHTFPQNRVLTPLYGSLPNACQCALVLTGEGDYTVRDVLLLGEREQNGGQGVTLHTDCVEYELTALHPRALSLAAPPLFEDGGSLAEGSDYRRLSHTGLALDNSRDGTYRLQLRLSHEPLTADSAAPDLRKDAMHLLPMLTAAYAWLDLDRDKALFYLNLYREAAAYRQTAPVSDTGAAYGDVNGW